MNARTTTHHVAVPVKRLHARKQLFVVPQGDEHLRVIPDGLLEDGQGALADLVLLERTQLSLVELGLGNVYVLTVCSKSASGGGARDGGYAPHGGRRGRAARAQQHARD